MTGFCVRSIVFGIILSANVVGINGQTACNSVETPSSNMCQITSYTGTAGQSFYLDSSGAPDLQKVACTCTLKVLTTGTTNIDITYRPLENVSDCNVLYRIESENEDREWGCKDKTINGVLISKNGTNMTYIKNDDVRRDWFACMGLHPLTNDTISVSCYAYKIYYAPDDDVDGVWGTWSTWRECSVTCGEGTKNRTRNCDDPAPQNAGAPCTKTDGTPGSTETETSPCNEETCQGPINGKFGTWNSWTDCSQTCNGGTQTRTRTCDSPAPENGGQDCTGDSDETRSCEEQACPVNGQYGDWEQWTYCSRTCDGGTQTRSRTCDDPLPQNGGEDCSGDSSESRNCNAQRCPVDGKYGDWTSWTDCTVTCNGGTRTRTRTCDNPAPQFDGQNCSGDSSQTQDCNSQFCPVNGQYSEWNTWSECSNTCNGGIQSRSRTCDNPTPQNGGQNCSSLGDASQTRICNTESCPGSGGEGSSTTPGSTTGGTGEVEQTEAQVVATASTTNIGALVGGIIGGLLFLLIVILLVICLIRRRRRRDPEPKTGPRSVRYMSGADVTVTENELYNYDGETPANATNALFIGGIPETPQREGYIPHFSTDTGDRYAVIMDSTRSKPKVKERPSLQSFQKSEDDPKQQNGNFYKPIDATDSAKLTEDNDDNIPLGLGVDNPGYEDNYIAACDSPDGEKPKTSSSASPSPYDYIDHEKLKKDDVDYEREQVAGEYATLPDERDDTESEYNGRYKRFISKERDDPEDDGYLKSPTRDTKFEYPDIQ